MLLGFPSKGSFLTCMDRGSFPNHTVLCGRPERLTSCVELLVNPWARPAQNRQRSLQRSVEG